MFKTFEPHSRNAIGLSIRQIRSIRTARPCFGSTSMRAEFCPAYAVIISSQIKR